MLSVTLHFNKDETCDAAGHVHRQSDGRPFACLTVRRPGEVGIKFFFDHVEQIEMLVAGLQEVGNKLAEATDHLPVPDSRSVGAAVERHLSEEQMADVQAGKDVIMDGHKVSGILADTDELPLAIEEAGECRGCKRAVAPGADLCSECESIAEKIAF